MTFQQKVADTDILVRRIRDAVTERWEFVPKEESTTASRPSPSMVVGEAPLVD